MFWFLRQLSSLSLVPAFAWIFLMLIMSSASTTIIASNSDFSEFSQSELIEVVICTPDGLKMVVMTPDGDIQGEGEAYPDCSWCQKFQVAYTADSAQGDYLKIQFDSKTVQFQAFTERTYGRLHFLPYTSRAPPTLIRLL